MSRIRERSAEPITLRVAAWNAGALELYRRNGFVIISTFCSHSRA